MKLTSSSSPVKLCTVQEEQQQQLKQAPACPSEAQLIRASRHKQPQGHFLVEPGFDTSDAAVFSAACFSEQDVESLRPVVWRRVTGPLIVPTAHYGRLVPGCLCRSTWFLGALAAVATRQRLLLNIIVSDEQAAAGLCTFQFYKHGQHHQVVVDNRLPVLELQQRLAFASSSTPQELWPSLVEKAYARLHGAYAAIATGCVADALIDLTGGIVDTLSLTAGSVSEGAVWLHIMQALSTGNGIAVCLAEQQGQQEQQEPAATTAAGLLVNSAYSILAAKALPSGLKLLRLHNPWSPEGCWQGAWGPGAPEWATEEGQAVLAADAAMEEGLQDPSTFWCSLWGFMEAFTTLHLLQLPDSRRMQQASAVGGWAGGLDCSSHAVPGSFQDSTVQQQPQQQVPAECLDWACRPQFKLVVAATCEVVLSLGQQDARVCHSSSSTASQHILQQQQQQQEGGLDIGLRVSHAAGNSRPALHAKALAAAGLGSRPGTSIMCSSTAACLGGSIARGSSRGGSRSRSPSRPGTAPQAGSAAAVAADEAAASTRHRVWVPGLHPSVADSGLSSSRDVVVRFVAEGGRTYVLMPYTRHATDTGAFVLRAWAPCAVQLEQLPAPHSLTAGGQWLGSSAGGSRAYATWASNPHFVITCPREVTVLLCLQRPDVCNSLLPQPFDAAGCISLTVCQPHSAAPAAAGRVGTPAVAAAHARLSAAAATASKVVGATDSSSSSSSSSMDRTALLVKLQPDTQYTLVPSTAQPGVEVPFELLCFSSYPLELSVLPRQSSITLNGSWQEGSSAGGSNLHGSWLHNPAFTLQLERKAVCRITLTRKGSWRRNQPLGHMIGLSALRLPTAAAAASAATSQQQSQRQQQRRNSSLRQQQPPNNSLTMLREHQLHEAAFVPMQSCEVEWLLPGGVPLLLVPCTYAPGMRGQFSLTVTAGSGGGAVSCEPVPGGLAALLAATGTRVTRLTEQ